MKELKVGMRLKLVRGSGDSNTGEWYAGSAPVGSKGVVYAQGRCLAIKFDGIQPKSEGFFGLHGDALENDRYELFEVVD